MPSLQWHVCRRIHRWEHLIHDDAAIGRCAAWGWWTGGGAAGRGPAIEKSSVRLAREEPRLAAGRAVL